MLLVFILYALFGSIFVIAKSGLEVTEPLFFVGSRMLVAGLLMLAYQYIFNRKTLQFSKTHVKHLLQLGLFNIYLTNAFEFWGLQHLTAFKTCFIYSLSPFLSALFSYFAFSEKMTKIKWIGLLIGFAGFTPILLSQGTDEAALGHLLFLSWAEISVILAVVCSMYGWIVLRKLVKDQEYCPISANAVAMCFGGIIALGHSALVETWAPLPITNMPTFLECTLLLIIISNLICYNLYGHLLKTYTATFMSFAGWTTPVFAALFGWLHLGETVSWHFYLSAAIVLVGLCAFYEGELRQGYMINAKPEPIPDQEQVGA